MGLDIYLRSDVDKRVNKLEKDQSIRLSRAFHWIVNKFQYEESSSILGQIGRITEVDLNFLKNMMKYAPIDEVEDELKNSHFTHSERMNILHRYSISNKKNAGNVVLVNESLQSIIETLNSMEDLSKVLSSIKDWGELMEWYFSDFPKDTGDGYIGNNFGQDLRNFEYFTRLVLTQKGRTVWFSIG